MEFGGRQNKDGTASFDNVKIIIEGEDDILGQRFGMRNGLILNLLSELLMLKRNLFILSWSILRILLQLLNLILILRLQQINGIH